MDAPYAIMGTEVVNNSEAKKARSSLRMMIFVGLYAIMAPPIQKRPFIKPKLNAGPKKGQ